VRPTLEQMKVMMIVAFHKNQVAGFKILPKNTNFDPHIYFDFLEKIIVPYVQKHRIRRPLILHDNAHPHKHQNIKSFFTSHRWEKMKHHSYSPDLNPCDYDGIMRIKRPLKGRLFENEIDLRAVYEQFIKEINEQNSAIGISQLPLRWKMVMKLEGEYII
jgi:hypothetical protein